MDDVSLRDYFERRLADHATAHIDHAAAHDREHASTQRAIDLAAELAKENKADANEWRAAMTDREASFARKDALAVHEGRIGALEDAGIARTAREEERARAQVRTMALIGLGATLAGFLLSLLTSSLFARPA